MIPSLSRRDCLRLGSSGFGGLALAALAGGLGSMSQPAFADATSKESPLSPKPSHFKATAKRVVFLCMQGGPSHVDTFDYKPQLDRDAGKPGRFGGRLLPSPWKFNPHGESGLMISELFTHTAKHADDLCLIRSMQCDQPVHSSAMTQMHTGTAQFIRPSLGSWLLYGLGSESESLPGYVSLSPPPAEQRNYGHAFLPAIYGGTAIGRGGAAGRFGGSSDAIADIRSASVPRETQRKQLDFIQSINREKLKQDPDRPDIEGVIESYELAFRMQDRLPEVMDVSDEDEATLRLYGADSGPTQTFGRQCLMARRMLQAGVRFVEVTHGNWDQHARLQADHAARAEACDQPIAALLSDLKRLGMLEDTLVIWGGEFGRTPAAQGADGRNHNNKGYTTWMAGGGVRGGQSYGATDEHGYESVEKVCHVHDWHATILHALGLDHKRLTYRYAGRDFRLTDVHGEVLQDIWA
jgi:Protein of unknown function (DUF1501)